MTPDAKRGRAVTSININLDTARLQPKAIVGDDDLSLVSTSPHCLTRGQSPYCVPFNDAWQQVIQGTALIVDQETLTAIRKNELHTLEDLAVATASPRVRRLNHRLAKTPIAAPISRHVLDLWNHIVPHTGFMVGDNVVVSVKHLEPRVPLDKLRFAFGAKWDPATRSFDIDDDKVYKVKDNSRKRICKKTDCVAYLVEPVNESAGEVQPVEYEPNVQTDTNVTALTHSLGMPMITVGREPTRPCDMHDCAKYHCYAALDVFGMASGSPAIVATETPKVIGMVRIQSQGGKPFVEDSESGEAILVRKKLDGSPPMAGILKMHRIIDALEKIKWI